MNLSYLFILLLSTLPLVTLCNPLERVIAHAHVRDGKLHACPDHLCEMEPSTKLYFWIVKSEKAPNMFLRTRSRGQTMQITTTHVPESQKIPRLTKELKEQLQTLSRGRPMQIVEATFPDDRMSDLTYTFLMTDDYRSWIAADMVCSRHERFMERFRRGQRLACYLDKHGWRAEQ